MERLTKRLPSGAADYNYPKSCYFGDGSGADRIAKSAFRQRCVEQLADYEDTERTPEEIDMDHEAAEQLRRLCRNCDLDRLEKLAEADKDGRLVVLGHPRRRVMWGDVEPDRLLCPECGNDLAGGFPEQASANLEMVNCPYCGEYLNLGRKTETVKHWRR